MGRFAVVVAVAVAFATVALVAPAVASPFTVDPQAAKLAERDSEICRNASAAVASSSSCTVLYAHMFDLLGALPLTTQPPSDACPDLAKGFTSVPALPPLFDTAHVDLYSVPTPITFVGDRCEPRFHPIRGLAADVALDARVPLAFHWFLSADTDDMSMLLDPASPDTGAMPCVEVRVTLQTGRVFGQGSVLAQGSARRTVLSSGAAQPQRLNQLDPCAQGELVMAHHPFLEVAEAHEFPVSLGPLGAALPADEGFLVHVEWSQVRDGPVEANQREWNVRSGPDYRNRLVLPVLDPLLLPPPTVERFGEHHLVVNASVLSPWGSYDVDAKTLRLEILDENGHAIPAASLAGPLLRYSVDHDGLLEPVNATWAWDFLRAQANPGPYAVRVTAANLQASGVAVHESQVDVPALFLRPAPGPALPVLLLGFAVALARVRRL